jgi:hypothetical protein
VTIATAIAGGVAVLIGLSTAAIGWIAVSAGRGGFGYGPFPFLKQPTEWDLIAIGLVLVTVGSVISGAGLTALGVLGA